MSRASCASSRARAREVGSPVEEKEGTYCMPGSTVLVTGCVHRSDLSVLGRRECAAVD